ncbi:uncharacterized protein DDB_G0284459-like, partial [Zootermopsis nevadensis]|uniref:uncharacterized protein DDB_G0284459-like n=1 Tax=Zootermopsis nevadensis TaxID=136037 RepID=UPI000B8EC6E0
ILQRHSVKTGQLLVQSVATCLFLCMDSCGLLYGSRNSTGDCVFNETFVHSYITYSSSKYSNDRRTLYIALSKRGQSRKVQVPKKAPLGKLFSYAMVVIKHVEDDRVKNLAERILRVRESLQSGSRSLRGDLSMAQHPLRHHGYHHLCPQVQASSLQMNNEQEDGTDDAGRDKLRCRRRKKRKKKKKKKCQQGEGEEECQKRLEAAKRRRKSRNGDKKLRDDNKKNKKIQKDGRNKNKFVSDGEVAKDFSSDRTRTDGVGEYTMTTQSESPAATKTMNSTASTTSPYSTPLSSTALAASSVALSSSSSSSSASAVAAARLSSLTTEDSVHLSSSSTSTTSDTGK